MADPRRDRPNLRDEDVSVLRNRQRNSGLLPRDPDSVAAEENATQEAIWNDPGGEAHAYRAATTGAGGDASAHGDLTARETPETTRRLATGEPTSPDADRDAGRAADDLGQSGD